MSNVYVALLHHPVYNKHREIVTTSITGFDLHDIARSCATFGVKNYYVVNPLPTQREFVKRIFGFWMDDESLEFNWTRVEAFKLVKVAADLDEVIKNIEEKHGVKPKIIGTSAKPHSTVSSEALREEIEGEESPYLVLFGTGWGISDELFGRMDAILPPIEGKTEYNHLSVRSATAIILYKLLGKGV